MTILKLSKSRKIEKLQEQRVTPLYLLNQARALPPSK